MESMVKKLKQKLRLGSSETKKERCFLENGSIFLEKLITDCNGKSIPIRNVSSSQIIKATNNFDSSSLVSGDGSYYWYKGIIEEKPCLIKRFFGDSVYVNKEQEAYNDIVLSARMSNHGNFLKLIGCCFEFSLPVAVFEHAEHAVLNARRINGEEFIVPWNVRLKMAKEIANAVTYLHTAFPRITIHRNIKPTAIFLDENWTTKLSDFSLSVTLPEGKSRIQVCVARTYGYCDPLYLETGFVTEYTDVYSFGVCLLVFLTGRSAFYREANPDGTRSDLDHRAIIHYVKGLYENGKPEEVIDATMETDITSVERVQVEACVVLALKCCQKREEDRPKMIQLAKELKRIERMEQSIDASSAI